MNARHPLIEALTIARVDDLEGIVGTDTIALVDEVWAKAIALVGDSLAAGQALPAIRDELLRAWGRDTGGPSPDWDTALVGSTWARVLVAFDAAGRP